MEGKVHSYNNLIVRQKSIDMVVVVCELTEQYPKNEMYRLTQHSKKTSGSVLSNIAEGRRKHTRKDYQRFLNVACSSGAEMEK
jgi:four helix bundle protein